MFDEVDWVVGIADVLLDHAFGVEEEAVVGDGGAHEIAAGVGGI